MTRSLLLVGALALVSALVPATGRAETRPEHPVVIENNRFEPTEIHVKADQPFTLVITNKDKGAEEFESRSLRLEKVIPGGKTVRLRMPALKAGTYDFYGDYHQKTANGRLIAE